MADLVTSKRWIGGALVLSIAVLAGCGSSGEDTSSPTGSVSATAPGSSLPTTAAGEQAPPTTTDSGTDMTDGYVEVGSEELLGFGPDGTTETIEEPLNDGTYYANTYSLAADGSGIVFDLAHFTDADACIDARGTVPTGTVDISDCFGGVLDTSRTAQVTLPVDGPVPVIVVFDCGPSQSCTDSGTVPQFRVSSPEFARLLRGETPSAAAPAGFEFQPFWPAFVEIRDGSIVRVDQRWTS
jgi:hypothetical protein